MKDSSNFSPGLPPKPDQSLANAVKFEETNDGPPRFKFFAERVRINELVNLDAFFEPPMTPMMPIPPRATSTTQETTVGEVQQQFTPLRRHLSILRRQIQPAMMMPPGVDPNPNAYLKDASGNYTLPQALLTQYPALVQMNRGRLISASVVSRTT